VTAPPLAYAVRFSAQAQQDIVDAAFRLADLTQDPDAARAWADSLYGEAARLAVFPHAHPLAARETRLFGRQTRQLLYRRTATATAYRLLFVTADAGDDGPTVTIIPVRHSGRRAPTRDEARHILANQ